MHESVRQGDLVARWGGEEFVVLLPRADLRASEVVAEKLRQRVEGFDPGCRGARVTISVGIGGYPAPGVDSLCALTEVADQALYRAKGAGRNRTESLRPPVAD